MVKKENYIPNIIPTIHNLCSVLLSDLKFSSSGREDVDVRMLGLGRPFLFELVNPRKVYFSKDEMLKMQENVNSSSLDIFIRDLQVVSK